MNFTSLFIKRPVLSSVVSLLIFLFGLSALFSIQVRQFPKMDTAVITVTTAYPGANAELIAGFITTPLESAVASASGIDYLTSSSTDGVSTITANIRLNFDPQTAFTEIMSQVQSVQNQLPPQAQQPIITKATRTSTLMYLSYSSKDMSAEQITDYATRVIKPKLETTSGVSTADIIGGKTYAMRIFLSPDKLAAHKVTPGDVWQVLAANNYQTAAGNTKGRYVSINLKADTDLSEVSAFKNLIVRNDNNAIVRLKDVAKIELGSESYASDVTVNTERSIFIGINSTPTANPLTVISEVRKILPSVSKNLPTSMHQKIVYDSTEFIKASMIEVMKTIFEASAIVIVVIFLFLGSLRSVLIPVVTIPLSLIGVIALMMMLGYSLNTLTLLALVLAIGLVVDDAIVVVENVHRHIEEGLSPFNAAITGAKEIAMPVIAMTITLAAVYSPIGFMGGLTGALFTEFAFTLACAVILSGIIALTLSPMMCSKILPKNAGESPFEQKLNTLFNGLKTRYQNLLEGILNHRKTVVFFTLVVLGCLVFFYQNTAKEIAPEEDQAFFAMFSTAPEYANIDYVNSFEPQFNQIMKSFPETKDYFFVAGFQGENTAFGGMILKPWDKRKTKQQALKEPLQQKLDNIAGFQTFAAIPPPLPGTGNGAPIQFVVTTTASSEQLFEASEKLLKAARDSGLFIYLENDLKFNKPQVSIHIDRAIASELGLNMQEIGETLTSSLSGGYVNYFNLQGRSYQVIPQLDRPFRMNVEALDNLFLRSKNNQMISLSTIADFKKEVLPNSITHFQQLNSATINGVMMPNRAMGDGIHFLEQKVHELLPDGFSYDFAGQSRQFIQEGNTLLLVFVLAILVIYLVLSAQFESFRDPLTVLVTVPLSICGALIPLNLGLASINIYTQIGLITLMGLISKHGILIVDFANHLQINEGLSITQAIKKSAATRLRPILMTTAAMVFGVLPLVFAKGAGAVSRFDIGLVIATGMIIGTCFSLFVVPVMYTFFAQNHAVNKQVDEI